VLRASLILVFSVLLFAEDQPSTTDLDLATAKAQVAFYKAQYLNVLAQLNARDAQDAIKSVSCGQYELKTDPQSGVPVCIAKKTKEDAK